MRLWLKTRRPDVALLIIALIVLGALATGDHALHVPAILGDEDLTVRLALATPSFVGIAVATAFGRRDSLTESVSARPVSHYDAAFLMAIAGAGVGGCFAITLFGGDDVSIAVGRNILGFLGAALLWGWFFGVGSAPVVPPGVFIVSMLLGRHNGTRMYFWAWAADPDVSWYGWVIAVAAFVLGLAAIVWGHDLRRGP